ncbi:MAG TPA: protein-L-isoaspartate O-methyltransferase [Nocardioidaceae bacterium]|nr:protein-L-isoaspartate O-methyltransferase [Nocardioidaceae bacterium]
MNAAPDDEPTGRRTAGVGAGNSAEHRVAAAMRAVDRAQFLHPEQASYAAEDRPIPIGHRQTNSQPTTVHNMLVLLDVQHGEAALDVGSGSGWTAALLGCLVGKTGLVHGVEIIAELADWGRGNVQRLQLAQVSIHQAAPGVLGWPAAAPYDKILVSAEARTIPAQLVDQLAAPGRMVVPVRGRLAVVDRAADGGLTERAVGHYAFVPLR